jgi:hypothetical protein
VAADGSQQQQQQLRQPGVPSAADATGLSPAQAKEALQLAKQANFVRAAAAIHHLQGSYKAALACYLALTPADDASSLAVAAGTHSTPRAAVFDYIDACMSSTAQPARQALMACVLQQMVALIRLDPRATAALLLQHQPGQQVPVLLSLQGDPQLQFQFLRAAMQQGQQLAQAGAAAAAQGSDAAAVAAGGAASDSLLERPEVAILYVKLLAQYEPAAVLPFLQSHHQYGVTEAIQVCRAAGECGWSGVWLAGAGCGSHWGP